MISKTFNRYIWLLNTLLQYKRLTFEEISNKWKESCIGDGSPLALRTFHVHRDAITELFGVEVKCDTSTYKYYIASPEKLRSDRTHLWLLNSFTLSNTIEAGHNMKDRILFEEIPHGTEYLQIVIEAMQQSKELVIDYQAFGAHRTTYHLQPYAMKVYHQRWYIVGSLREQDGIRNLALDRTLDMVLSDESFVLPSDFDAQEYYANTVGIYVNESLKPQKVIVRAYGRHVDYMRTLPLHYSQKEVICKHEQYSDFQYRLCLTPELTSQLLAMGEKVEVIEPKELREDIKNRLNSAINRYNQQEK
ncbi:WYL domain-containing protein [Segatella oulorum]|uniref:WYL domain-containing protein n=1 Tax=Segatella oulorum TaxID=28136 RepID=A0A1T4KE74_9BACT|nr:WYL domain-containing protein [Segatella oulorum]SJZ40686.1 WYL domain-containing protein [Segatella oulorum]